MNRFWFFILAFLLQACDKAPSEQVQKEDIKMIVNASGELESMQTATIAAPAVRRMWQFQIKQLTAENTKVKKGERHLTPAQAIQIADELGLDRNEVLIKLAIEKSKSDEEQETWSGVLSVIKKSGTAGLAVFLSLSPETIYSSAQCILC